MSKNNDVTIRKAKPEDGSGIATAHRLGWYYAHINDTYDITESDIDNHFGTVEKWSELFSKFVENGTPYYVAEVDNKVVGYSGSFKDKNDWTGSVYLNPKYVGQGIGSMLLETMLKDFSKGDYFFVGIAEFNKASEALFTKFGFKRTGETKPFKLSAGKYFPIFIMAKQF